ncbi:recombinase family protein [Longispora sp. NPDC051575]|uniref:recombinase family protein n=1 Tax=Longispora sp. NPDC051575 TaxID=3154943 RepID=UPI0034176D0E
MRYTPEVDGPDLLGWWIRQPNRRGRLRTRRRPVDNLEGFRFAFYGRISTKDWQDLRSSARWQRDFAEELIDGRGVIVAEFFDVGCSRRLPWPRRPEAARLLAALADPDRGFDAIVVGEFERAFYGDQFLQLAPLFALYDVQVWLPELNGPIDTTNHLHLSLLALLGVHSKREIQRARLRAKAAMRAQVIEEGRHLGGRPPYGYHLVDAGPHPNRAQARWGRRAQRLEPDPDTAPHVQWMFAERLAGRSTAGIARDLNDQGVPCPSRVDPVRNPHRSGEAWTLRTVAAILANPRYTGRQVWNKQRTDHGPLDGVDDLLGRSDARRWNSMQQWVISDGVAHPPLVSEEDFVAAQWTRTVAVVVEGNVGRYLLAGLLRCRECGRVLDSHWVHNHAGYRCRHGRRSTEASRPGWSRNVYVHERKAIEQLAEQLGMGHADPDAVIHYILENDALISCEAGGTVTLNEACQPIAQHPAAAIPAQSGQTETPAERLSLVVKSPRGG